MTNNRLTDEQIVKALECCEERDINCVSSPQCDICPQLSYFHTVADREDCRTLLFAKALDLINRQKEQFHYLDVECERLEKENEKLEAEIERLKKKKKASKGFWDELAYVDVDDINNLVKEMVGEKDV